jgi:hypothetical protein
MHIDIHGKMDKSGQGAHEIELGVASLEEWLGISDDYEMFAAPIIKTFK